MFIKMVKYKKITQASKYARKFSYLTEQIGTCANRKVEVNNT